MLSVLVAVATASVAVRAANDDDPVIELGRALTAQFQRGDTTPIWERMTPEMQRALKSPDGLTLFRARVMRDAGDETTLVSERHDSVGNFDTYVRVAHRSRAPMPIVVTWTFDRERRIAGFNIRPQAQPAATPNLDYQTQAQLRLPFDGEWYVFWGGRTLEQNYHIVARDQRFAYDFLVRNGERTHAGDGRRVEDYYCWNRAIRAPAPATIVVAVDQYADNAPGQTDVVHPAGNHVILDIGRGEYALLAHLRHGSVRARSGDRVEAGAELGRCGNSGNTTEPHLHFHLQDSPRFGDGNGLPAFFVDYVANGIPVARGEPVRGQTVSPTANVAGTRAQ
jgi:hypothetical protein